ncbi:hypothetical protein Tco_0089308 [Tanacetum coccineum]
MLVYRILELMHVHFRDIYSDEKCRIAWSECNSIQNDLKCGFSWCQSARDSFIAFSDIKSILFGNKLKIKLGYELPPSLMHFLCQPIQHFWRYASHTELFDQEVESFSVQRFSKDVSQLVFSPDKVYLHDSILHLLLYEMVANIDVLSS